MGYSPNFSATHRFFEGFAFRFHFTNTAQLIQALIISPHSYVTYQESQIHIKYHGEEIDIPNN